MTLQAGTLTLKNQHLAKDFIHGPADPDVVAYVAAVEAADGAGLEEGVKVAYADFITGCKADGIWNSIKASCILAGARTLNGALVPLVGSAPTNVGPFIGSDYDRKTGLLGNGSKYLNANRADNADGQTDSHRSVYVTTPATGGFGAYIGLVYTSPSFSLSFILRDGSGNQLYIQERDSAGSFTISGAQNATGFIGGSRANSVWYNARVNGSTTQNFNIPSTPVPGGTNFVFSRSFNGTPDSTVNAGRISFYSIGSALDLSLLDSRVSTLMTDLAAAIP